MEGYAKSAAKFTAEALVTVTFFTSYAMIYMKCFKADTELFL